VSGVKIDPDWVTGYAKTAVKAADQLSGASDGLNGDPLGNEAFGDLGRQVHTAEAYLRASTTLRDQLTRAIETLHAASDSLNEVASRHRTNEQDSAQTIKRAEHR
jgi:hypothetical protein